MLLENRSDGQENVVWAAIGSAAGSAPGAIPALYAFVSNADFRLSGENLIQIIVLFCSFFSGLVAFIWSRKKPKRGVDLVAQIRSRTNSITHPHRET